MELQFCKIVTCMNCYSINNKVCCFFDIAKYVQLFIFANVCCEKLLYILAIFLYTTLGAMCNSMNVQLK